MSEEEKKKLKQSQHVLRFKNGAYLTPKVERIMLQLARGKTPKWIADLYDVRENFVHYVGRKTGFPSSTFYKKNASAKNQRVRPRKSTKKKTGNNGKLGSDRQVW